MLGKWISLEKIEDKPMNSLSTKEEKWDGKSRHSKAENLLSEKGSQLGAGCRGIVQDHFANGEAIEPNIRTIIDVCISAMSKNVTKKFEKFYPCFLNDQTLEKMDQNHKLLIV